MKIAFDATSLCRKTTGIEYYAFNLLKHLLAENTATRFIVLCKESIKPELEVFRGKAEFIVCPSTSQLYCEQVWIPSVLRKLQPDLVHFPAFPPGLLVSVPHVMTIHDATMWKYPETTSWKNKLYMKPLSELALRRAKCIITVSESSRGDISRYTGMAKSRIVNTYESINERFRVIADKKKLSDDLERRMKKVDPSWVMPKKFILSVGSFEPRKNLKILLEAFALLKQQSGFEHKLVLIGRKAWGNASVMNKITELGLSADMLMTGHLSDEDLVVFYNLADVFVYPSLYEGFGLPPLEAMACGTPVLTSNVSSLPEVVGDAALLVDPLDVKTIAEGVRRLVEDQPLREQLRGKGLLQVKKFSWQDTVKRTNEAYEMALNLLGSKYEKG